MYHDLQFRFVHPKLLPVGIDLADLTSQHRWRGLAVRIRLFLRQTVN